MVDGDTALVVSDKTIIEVAKRTVRKYDVVPLYYEMKKAKSVILNNESIYNGITAAFTGGNIGMYSNNISKIWNNDVFINGEEEKKKHAIDCVKRLVCQNNFVIDQAKTLYVPEFPDNIKQEIQQYTNCNLPTFFKYAKDKTDEQVEQRNGSFVNQLYNIIKDVRLNFKYIGLEKPDYELLMNNPYIDFDISFGHNGKLIVEKTCPIVVKYLELSKENYLKIDSCKNVLKGNMLNNYKLGEYLRYKQIKDDVVTELSKFGYSDIVVADILVKFLYGVKDSKYKDVLWVCYGDILLNNLKRHFKSKEKVVQCDDCGEWFFVNVKNNQSHRCPSCYSDYRKKYKLEYKNIKKDRTKQLKNTLF